MLAAEQFSVDAAIISGFMAIVLVLLVGNIATYLFFDQVSHDSLADDDLGDRLGDHPRGKSWADRDAR